MAQASAFVALNRFGLGARPGEAEAMGDGGHDWVLRQIAHGEAPQVAGVQDTPGRYHGLDAFRRAKAEADKAEAAKLAAVQATPKAPQGAPPAAPLVATQAGAPALAGWGKPGPKPDQAPGTVFDRDVFRRAEHMVASDWPVAERLAAFWCNHFAIAISRDEVMVAAVPYENEAIRPHVFGRFRDMLGATAVHPAMAFYLDAASSVGPDSPVGRLRHKSVNENYAREVMELHTLGVKGGYSQADVQELALALTGLGVDVPDGEAAWFFDRHQPGDRTVLRHVLPARGDQLNAALDLLASHPATVRHVTTKLAVHFCGDAPAKATLRRLETAWHGSGGDLPTVYKALVAAPEVWVARPLKYRSPQDFVLAAARAVALHAHGRELVAEMRGLGQAPFRAPAPTGWGDMDGDWIGPAGVVGRVASAQRLAALAPGDAGCGGFCCRR